MRCDAGWPRVSTNSMQPAPRSSKQLDASRKHLHAKLVTRKPLCA